MIDLKTNDNIFITGAAGTGKSYQIAKIVKKYSKVVKIALTATTGIAATNIGGQTIHSFLKLGMVRTNNLGKETKRICSPSVNFRNVLNTDVLIIDEISMCDGFLFDLIDNVLKEIKMSNLPFGGIKLVIVGDCFQLPPVQAEEKGFFFDSNAYANGRFMTIVLDKIYRQSDKEFIDCLNRIRISKHTDNDIEYLNKRDLDTNYANINTTCLYPTNKEADKLNLYRLNKLQSKEKIYNSKDVDYTLFPQDYDKQLRCPKELKLKIGAKILLLKNLDLKKGLCNGTSGVIVKMKEDFIIIKVGGKEHLIQRADFEVYKKGKLVFTRKQFPLTLGWGISIHKSQGMSLDSVAIDFNKTFAPHQSYVALSRAKNYEGLYLRNLTKNKIYVDAKVVSFMEGLKNDR